MTAAVPIQTLAALDWAPLVDPPVLAALLAAVVLLAAVGWWLRQSCWLWRVAPGLVLLGLLANPQIVEKQQTPLPDVAFVVQDTSDSMTLGDRPQQRDDAARTLSEALNRLSGLEVRTLSVSNTPDHRGTRLLTRLEQAAADVPPERRAGAVILTDGQVHDETPADRLAAFGAPVHVLLAGTPEESDRLLTVESAPSFGLVDRVVSLTMRVDDHLTPAGTPLPLSVRHDDGTEETVTVRVGQPQTVPVRITHGGTTVTDLSVPVRKGEISTTNNRQAVGIAGVRDRLKVLLISGEPTVGERAWRTLLKADPNVDLVHFTILRPPLKDDGTPLNELALISFPVQELFEDRLKDFDLVIFDRYSRRALVPTGFFRLLANYVRSGGALLLSVGPEFSQASSLYDSPLADIIPVTPTGSVPTGPFLPRVSPTGLRHPVTGSLPGGEDAAAPTWGPWLRYVDTRLRSGALVLQTPDGAPLLALDRVESGRVGVILSDTIWLWARGWQGGGPQADLVRRLAHWLMQEPDLEEESLTLRVDGTTLLAERRTLSADLPPPLTLTGADGTITPLALNPTGPGRATASLSAPPPGVYRVTDGTRTAVAAVPPPDPLESAALVATDSRLRPPVEAAGGTVRWLKDGVPDLRRISASAFGTGGRDWIGLRRNDSSVTSGLRQTPLIPALIGLALVLGALFTVWWREGR